MQWLMRVLRDYRLLYKHAHALYLFPDHFSISVSSVDGFNIATAFFILAGARQRIKKNSLFLQVRFFHSE
jgi:hypothetical protein